MTNYRKIFIVIFLCSSSSLAYEIALTRVFSISLWYHFAFMIISIAMIGIGASGTVLSLYPRLKHPTKINIYALLLGISISVSYVVSNQILFDPVRLPWDRMQLLYIGLYYVILSIPFFFTGLIIATAFSCTSERAGLLYCADLLGAGMGSMGILYLMTTSGPEKAVFIISSIALSAAFITGGKGLKTISIVLITLNLSLIIFHPSLINIRMSPYKGLQIALRYPGAEQLKTYFNPFSRIDMFRSPAVRFAPGLSLRYLDALPEQIGFSIDGGEINAITSAKGEQSPSYAPLTFLRYLPSALPYEIVNPPKFPHTPLWQRDNPPIPPLVKGGVIKGGLKGDFKGRMGGLDDVLILDPKGGMQAMIAEYYGSSNIYKIESNPLLIKVIKKDFNEFSGGIYSENTWSGLGRSWLRSGHRNFDIIDVSLMGTVPHGSFGISENYRFTVEAFMEYIGHLKPDGILSINLFILPPPRIELRLLNTAITSMEELGIKDIEKQVVAIRSWGSICILVKKAPFSPDEIEAIKVFSKDRWFDLIYYPGIKEEETNIYIRMPSNEYFTAFKSILNPETRRSFVDHYIFDIRPVRDDNPFFHYYLKLKNIKTIYKIIGEKWQYFIEEGYILPAVFIQVLFLSLILILLPAFSPPFNSPLTKGGIKGVKGRMRGLRGKRLLPYFAFLGIGFMFVEVSLIQKIILPLENPSCAVATVLASILISSGIGSLLSYRFPGLRSPSVAIALSFLIIVYSILLPTISDIISPHSMPVKIISVFFTFMPLSLLMGIPFPTGLKILGERNESLIPWAWAINGCLSVLTPILAIMLAMVIGFKIVLWIGALMYAMAFITIQNSLRKAK
jgi:hypothetical protein